MTRDDIIRMAREAADPDAVDPLCGSDWGDLITLDLDEMVRFVALVAKHEREACAQIVDANAAVCANNLMLADVLASNAAAIRARGEEP